MIMWLWIKTLLFAGNIKMLTFCLSVLFSFCLICHQISPRLRNANKLWAKLMNIYVHIMQIILGTTWLGIISKYNLHDILPMQAKHTQKHSINVFVNGVAEKRSKRSHKPAILKLQSKWSLGMFMQETFLPHFSVPGAYIMQIALP